MRPSTEWKSRISERLLPSAGRQPFVCVCCCSGGEVFMPSLSCYLPLNIFFMSLSLLRASTGVRLLMSRPRISSRICESTGSSSWKKLSCMSGVEVRCDVLARPTLRGALPSVPCSLCRWHHTMESIPLNKTASPCLPWPGNKAQGNRIQKRGGTHDIWLPHCLSLFLLLWEGI